MSAIMSRVILNSSFEDTEVQDGKVVYNFDKHQHAQVLLRNLIAMQDNDEGIDVIMISKDNEQFHFHGPILAALSKDLEEILLEQGPAFAASKTFKIVTKENLSSEAVRCLWDYAYTSVVTLIPSNINEVKQLAEHHGLDNLKKECELLEQQGFRKDSDGVELEFKNLPASISKRLYRLLEDGKLCSAVITGTDPLAKIPYHGAVVAATCSDFSELGHGDSNENLKVDDATFQAMAPLLMYLYTGCLVVEPANVQLLLEMAVTLNLPGMEHACCCWLEDALTADNVLGIMETAQAWKAKAKKASSETNGKDSVSLFKALDELYQTARAFALRYFLSVQDNDEYLEMCCEELIELIDDDDLVVNTEKDVFHAVMKWVEFDSEIRAEELPNLLQSVRLEHLSIGFLDTIMEHDLVKANSLCVEVIQKALKDLLQSYPPKCNTQEKDHFSLFSLDEEEEAEASRPDFNQKLFSQFNYDPTYGSQYPPDQSPSELDAIQPPGFSPFDTSSLSELLDPPCDGPSLQEPNVPRHLDMRLRRNRKAFLERGKNVDGTPDKRFQENKTRSSVAARKLTYPDKELPRRKDGQLDRRFKVVKELEQKKSESGNLASGDIPRTKNGKPDMRFKVNKMKLSKQKDQNATLKLLPQGPNREDGQPDMRFKANRFPKQGVLCTGPTRTDGQPDMRYATNKQKINIDYQTPHREAPTAGPNKKDGTRDMRFAENKKAAALRTSSVPLKNDGTPDMRFAVNKLPSGDRQPRVLPGPLKTDGTPDMRFAANKGFSGTFSSGPLKNDGTPDMRYRSNHVSSSSTVVSASPGFNGTMGTSLISNSGNYPSTGAFGPLKNDGTPDKRYASNKSSSHPSFGLGYASLGGSTTSVSSNSSGSYGSFPACGPLKNDGTPDMRYASNKSSSHPSFGLGYPSLGGSTTSTSSSSSGSYGYPTARGPLKNDGTPDMRYSSNKSSSSSSFGSGSSSSSGWSTSSFSSGYSGSSSFSASSGPLKKDGTPDMRYKSNRR